MSWQDDALCAETDPDLFFPDNGGSAIPAKKVCGGCDVRTQCLQYALDNRIMFGVWGGAATDERRRMLDGAA